MNKRKLFFPVLAAFTLMLVACGGPNTSSGSPSEPESTPESEPLNTYEVTFNSKGGSPVRKQEVEEGSKVNRPANPTKGGNKFVDWYTEDSYENIYDFDTPVTSSFTLYAKWELSTDKTLVGSSYYYSTDGDTEFSLFYDDDTFKAHTINGWIEGCSFNMSWRTIVAVDAQGRICYGVWCPANGYGNPAEYTYVCNEYYGPNGVTYTENPAIRLGNNYNSNNNDFEIVIPEGGFIITGHTNGSNDIAAMVTGETYLLYGEGADFDENKAKAFNKTHGEWSTRSFELNLESACIDVYDLATHVTFTGDYSGAFTGDAATSSYTRTMKIAGGKAVEFYHYDGLLKTPITTDNYEFDAPYGDGEVISAHPENPNALLFNKTGNYTFTLNIETNTFTVTREEVSDFKINLVDVIGKVPAFVGVVKGESYTLPTPINVPAGYTFKHWVNGEKQVIGDGIFNSENDITLYATYDKGGKDVAYSGKLSGFSIDADSELTLWSAGTIFHTPDGWLGNGWRVFFVFDAEGRLAYGCLYPPNGYGGPDGGSYMSHDFYKNNYANNPALEVLSGYGPWEPGGSAHNQFNVKVPTGGFGISAHGAQIAKLIAIVTNNAFPGFDGTNEGEYEGLINSSNVVANNTFSYDSAENTFYSSLF